MVHFARKSKFNYNFDKKLKILKIVDLYDGNSMTVTNNIDNVLEMIYQETGIDYNNYAIIYQDTNFIWDGYDSAREQFINLNADTYELAIEKMRIRNELKIK